MCVLRPPSLDQQSACVRHRLAVTVVNCRLRKPVRVARVNTSPIRYDPDYERPRNRRTCLSRARQCPLEASARLRPAVVAPPVHAVLLVYTPFLFLRRRCCIYSCVLCSSMLMPAAERRPMVTPISYLEGRKCSFLLYLLLLFLWHHNQSCSPHRDMSIQTLTSVYFGRQLGFNWTPPKM